MKRLFEFGPFRLNEGERTLLRDGSPVPLTPKAFDTLVLLVSQGGHLVEKERLLRTVWGGVHVGEAVLTRAVSDLRKALRQGDGEVWISTVPKFGYRIAAEIREASSELPPGPSPRSSYRLSSVAAVLLVILAALAVRLSSHADPAEGQIRHLAVLPFQILGQAAPDDAAGAGVADAIITRLSNLRGLVVRPMSTVRRFEAPGVDPVQAGRDLRVDAVLEGTMQTAGGLVRAHVRLIRPRDGQSIWAETVEAREGQLFALQDSVAQQVAAHLAVRLSAEERLGLASRRELNPDVHRFYVKGRYEWGKRDRAGFEKAVEHFQQAIDLDPTYGRAHAGLADSYLLLGLYGHHPPLQMLPKAKVTALRALELAPDLAEAHATLGLLAQNLDWNWNEAERQYREALRMAPNYATARHWHAEFLSILGRFEESRREFAQARAIDPISSIIQVDEAQLAFFERRYDRSLAALERVAREDPSLALAHERMALTYLMQGREEEAWRESQLLPECKDASSDCRRIWTAWLTGRDPAAARRALAELEADASVRRVPPSALLVANARQGNLSHALDWLEYMLDRHEVWLITAKVNPLFDAVRGHPRTRAVLHKLGLD